MDVRQSTAAKKNPKYALVSAGAMPKMCAKTVRF